MAPHSVSAAPEPVKPPAGAGAGAGAASTPAATSPAAAENGGPVMRSGLTSSEERRRNGQYAAVCLVLVVAVMGLYHACTRQNALLAGFLVPALIMLLYLLWVLYSASRARAKQRLMQASIGVSLAPATTPAPTLAPAPALAPASPAHTRHHDHGKHHHGDVSPRTHRTHHTPHHATTHKIPKVVVQGPTPVRELEPEKIV